MNDKRALQFPKSFYFCDSVLSHYGVDWFWQRDQSNSKHVEHWVTARKSWIQTLIGENNYALAA